MASLTSIDPRRNVRVKGIGLETPTVRSFTFDDRRCRGAKPGQYVMVWIPGVDEVPMSLSAINRLGLSRVTVERVGDATESLHRMQVGDVIGVRGPFGNWFKPFHGRVLVVGGGSGLAPLIPLAEDLEGLGAEVVFVLGAEASEELLFLEELHTILADESDRIITVTEDGSAGLKGLATDVLEGLFEKTGFDMVYTCGSEPMMRRVFDIAEDHDTPIQACVERIIRCSIGLCGSCIIGGFRVCKDGPVLSSEQLRGILDEFGRFKRGFDGSRIEF